MGAAWCTIALRSPPDSLQGFAYAQHTMVVCWGGGLNKYQPLAADCLQPPVRRSSSCSIPIVDGKDAEEYPWVSGFPEPERARGHEPAGKAERGEQTRTP